MGSSASLLKNRSTAGKSRPNKNHPNNAWDYVETGVRKWNEPGFFRRSVTGVADANDRGPLVLDHKEGLLVERLGHVVTT